MNVIIFLLGAALLFLLWVALHDTTHFEVTEYVCTDPRIKKNCRAVILSDLHNQQYGRKNALLLKAIRDAKPDLVLIAGDMLTAKPGEDFDVALSLVRELAKDYPVCYGVGNHEYRLSLYRETYGDTAKRFDEALAEYGVRLMRNERKIFEDYGIVVVGSQIHHRFYRRRHASVMKESYLPRIIGAPDPERYTILIAHHPDYFPNYAAWGADLVLSGHFHGGAVRVPFWNKGVLSPNISFFPKYDGGLFEEGKSRMLLSRGLGCHTIPLRLFNPGDLLFVDFEKGETSKFEKKDKKKSRGKSALK